MSLRFACPPNFISDLTSPPYIFLTLLSFGLLSLLDRVAPGVQPDCRWGVCFLTFDGQHCLECLPHLSVTMFPHFPANRLKTVAYISGRRLLRTSWLSLQTTSGQFDISVYDYLRHFCVTSWLIADQQLVHVSFRLRQLPPNLADPHGEVDVFLVFLQSYLQRRSPKIDQQAGGGTVLVTPGGRACRGARAVSGRPWRCHPGPPFQWISPPRLLAPG